MRAHDLMQRNVIYVHEEDLLEDVIRVLRTNRVGGVPVVDHEKRLVGIVTERDLVVKDSRMHIPSYIAFSRSILSIEEIGCKEEYFKCMIRKKAKEIMSTPVYAVHQRASLSEVASMMVNRHINRVPVVDHNNQLVGIIGRSDLLP
ncbi:MAG: CBS domain-containing protein, partial [Cellulosilyticaceae bacterium]